MTYEPEERSQRHICDLAFQATDKEQREILLNLRKTKLWKDWATADYLIRYGRFTENGPEQKALAEQLVALDMQITAHMAQVIDKLETDRATFI